MPTCRSMLRAWCTRAVAAQGVGAEFDNGRCGVPTRCEMNGRGSQARCNRSQKLCCVRCVRRPSFDDVQNLSGARKFFPAHEFMRQTLYPIEVGGNYPLRLEFCPAQHDRNLRWIESTQNARQIP